MTFPGVVDRAPVGTHDVAERLRGWQLVVELVRLICAVVILLSVLAQDSVRYWLRQANGPVLTYRGSRTTPNTARP